MIELKPDTTPAILNLATQFESLASRYHSLSAIEFNEKVTVYWEQFTNEKGSIDWREVTPRNVYSLLRAKKARYTTLSQLGQKQLADALEEKYL